MTLQKARFRTIRLALGATALTLLGTAAQADFVINDDLIVDGSACIGFDCVNGESFGFDTLRLKENNTRIKFDDTSNSASFPRNKWELTANETTNGGAEKFSITDVTNSRIPFTIRGTAPNNSIFVATNGNVGLETGSPVVELHIADGDTPTIRLEQNGTSGFTPQTWDMAGNETNYFIRDVSNGSTLPFRIRPSAPTSSIDVEGTTGDVGIGTASPDSPIHVRRTNGTSKIHVEEASGTAATLRTLLDLEHVNGGVGLAMNSGVVTDWTLQTRAAGAQGFANNSIRITNGTGAGEEFVLQTNGNLTLSGTLTTGSSTVYPDYVFAPDYELMPLAEVERFIIANGHLPKIPTAAEVAKTGLNISEMQVALLEKVEELTLYALEQQKTIDALQQRLDTLAD